MVTCSLLAQQLHRLHDSPALPSVLAEQVHGSAKGAKQLQKWWFIWLGSVIGVKSAL